MRSNWQCVCFGVAAIFLAMAPAAFAAEYSVTPSTLASVIQTTINNLLPGDILDFQPGTYNAGFKVTPNGTALNPIIIRGVGSSMPILDGTGLNLTGAGAVPRGLMQIQGNYITVQNLAFTHATNDSGNGAGIRITGAGNTTVSGCSITYNNMGMMSDDSGVAGHIVDNVVITGNNIGYNGTTINNMDGYSHNMYMGGSGALTIVGNYIHDSTNGQNVKTRAHYVQLMYNWISNSNEGEVGMVDGYTSAANSNALIVGNTVVSSATRTGNHAKYILYGSESGTSHIGTAYIYNNTLIAGMSNNVFVQVSPNSPGDATYAVVKNDLFYGSNNLIGSSVTGNVSGSNDWMTAAAAAGIPVGDTFTSTVTGSDPKFVNPSANDFRLLITSAAIDAGTSTLTYLDGNGVLQSLSVTNSMLFSQNLIARSLSGSAMDIGAYEFQQVPEPATLTLLVLGGLGLMGGAIRRRRGGVSA